MVLSIIIYTLMLVLMVTFGKASASKDVGLYNYEKKNFFSWEEWVPIIFFSVLMGIRYDVGTDYLNYLTTYLNYRDIPDRWEFLFLKYTQICQDADLHFTFYFGIIAFVQIFCLYYCFKDNRQILPALLFFFVTSNTFVFWANGLRQSLAFCIWLPFLKYVIEKKNVYYLIGCAIAFLFHRSAFILIIILPVIYAGRDLFKSIPFQIVLILIAYIAHYILGNSLNNLESLIDKYSIFFGRETYDTATLLDETKEHSLKAVSTGIGVIIQRFAQFAVVIYSTKLKKYYKNKPLFILLYSLFFIGLLVDIVLPQGSLSLARPFYYFTALDFILLAYLIIYLKKNRNTKADVIRVGIIVLYALMFYGHIVTSNEYSHLWYQFFFNITNL